MDRGQSGMVSLYYGIVGSGILELNADCCDTAHSRSSKLERLALVEFHKQQDSVYVNHGKHLGVRVYTLPSKRISQSPMSKPILTLHTRSKVRNVFHTGSKLRNIRHIIRKATNPPRNPTPETEILNLSLLAVFTAGGIDVPPVPVAAAFRT